MERIYGKHNMGELLLGKNGKLVHINSKVWHTDKNNVLADARKRSDRHSMGDWNDWRPTRG